MATTTAIHQQLADHDRWPGVHVMDAGYINGELLVASQREHHVTLCGPVMAETSWQAHAGNRFAASDFQVDWRAHHTTCPKRAVSTGWKTNVERNGNPVVKMTFTVAVCGACSVRTECPRTQRDGRELTVRTEAAHTAFQFARRRAPYG